MIGSAVSEIWRFARFYVIASGKRSFSGVDKSEGCWRWRCRVPFLVQENFPAPGIPPEGGWAGLLLEWNLGLDVQAQPPCVQGEGEVRAHGEGELESRALAAQCLAEVQALGCQVGFTHCSHFEFF